MHDFRQLSPLDFENLVRDLLQAEFGLLFESFGPGKDGGIDFRFARTDKSTVIQVKHYVDSRANSLVRAAAKENAKVLRLKPSRYILATSVALSPALKDKLVAALPGAPLVREDVLGREDINNLLGRHPNVLRQHFKLWLTHTETLERIIHSGIYNRTDAELAAIKSLVPKFVHNQSIAEAECILDLRGALIIAGEPGVGKTTLARILTWLHLAQGWQVFVVDDLKEAMEVCTAGEKRLIFFDDFLGQISLTNDVIRNADQRLPIFLDRVRGNNDLRFILTTRSYLLTQAQMQSSKLASEKVAASELVLNVGTYTRTIRAQIVFNHIYFSDLTTEEKGALLDDHFYLKMIDHRNFNPRLIDMLTSADYQAIQNAPIQQAVTTVLDNPAALWDTPYRAHLSEDSRTVMRALFFCGHYTSVDALLQAFKRFSRSMGISMPDPQATVRFRHALKPLEGSIVSLWNANVFFSNPGVRDFLSGVIISDELISSAARGVGTFRELENSWDFYKKHQAICRRHIESEGIWIDALERIVSSGEESAIRYVRLGLEMCEALEHNELAIECTEGALQSLVQEGVDPANELDCRHAIEYFYMLDPDDRRSLSSGDALIQSAIDMLEGAGDSLTLDEIISVSNTIDRYSNIENLGRNAAHTALNTWISDLDARLLDVSSCREFDSFVEELGVALAKYEISNTYTIQRKLDEHREQLEKTETAQDQDGYESTGHNNKVADVSDEHVKSLFSTLLDRNF
jgi:hypothetical protein